MKLSTKLLTGLLGIILVMMLVSAFSIKSEFEKINQKDLFWNSIKLSNKPFKHLKVIGQKKSDGIVNILNSSHFVNNDFAVYIPKEWAEEAKISFEKDTLVVALLANPSKEDENLEYKKNATILNIFCPKISSIKGANVRISIDSLNQNKLYIEANKDATINISRMIISSLYLKIDSAAKCEFGNYRNFNIENLEANIASGADLQMRNVYPKNFILNSSEKSIIEMNGTALKAIKK